MICILTDYFYFVEGPLSCCNIDQIMAEKLKQTRLIRDLLQEKMVSDLRNQMYESELEKKSCQICCDRPRDCVITPCNHFLYCETCLNTQKRLDQTRGIAYCPYCRQPLLNVIKVKMWWRVAVRFSPAPFWSLLYQENATTNFLSTGIDVYHPQAHPGRQKVSR